MILESSIIITLIGGIGVGVAASIIGVFVLWKKMAYFGDAISHSAIFGMGIATIVGIEPIWGIIFCSIVFCFLIFFLSKQKLYQPDSIIGISSCVLISVGMILLVIFPSAIDLESYLFGNLVALNAKDLTLIYLVVAITSLAIFCWFKKLLLVTISPDLGKISGVEVEKLELKFLLLTALVVAGLVKVVGIFLITSMMIMPAAIARNFAKTPIHMLFIALFVSIVATFIGLCFATFLHLPHSPSIIFISALMLAASIAYSGFYGRSN